MSLPPSSPFSGLSNADLLDLLTKTPAPSPTPSFLAADLNAFMSEHRTAAPAPRRARRSAPPPFQLRQDELKAQLKAAGTLMSHVVDETTGGSSMVPIPWPQTNMGRPLALASWRQYTATHDFLGYITCFCSLKTGVPVAVKFFKVTKSDSEHLGDRCLGCKNWDRAVEGVGCGYFVNLDHLLEAYPNQDVFGYMEIGTAQAKKVIQRPKQRVRKVADPFPLSPDSTWRPPPRLPVLRKAPPPADEAQVLNPYIENGGVGCLARLRQPISQESATVQVRDVVPPSYETTRDMLMEGLLRRGISTEEFVRLVGVCTQCKTLVALCIFPDHDCIRPLVERRPDGSWVSKSTSARTLRPFPIPISALDDVYHTTTPLRDRYMQPFLSTDRNPAPLSPSSSPSGSGSQPAEDVFYTGPSHLTPPPSPPPAYLQLDFSRAAQALLVDLEINTANAQVAIAAADQAIAETHAAFGIPPTIAAPIPAAPVKMEQFESAGEATAIGLDPAARPVKIEQFESDGEATTVGLDPAARPVKRKRQINVGTQSVQKRRCLGFIDLTG